MYYDGSNWKWGKSDKAIREAYKKVAEEYEKKINHKGDEMDESLVRQAIIDLDKIAKKIEEIQAGLKVEKKEPRKMWQIIEDNFAKPNGYPETYKYTSRAAIDAVCEVYKDWQVYFYSTPKNTGTFPEYLKEKLL